jgi:predicted RNA-binding protein with PUA domain
MKIKSITYQRVRNLGNYESKRVEMTAEVESGEDELIVFDKLETLVNKALYLEDEKEIIRDELRAKYTPAYPEGENGNFDALVEGSDF